MKWVNPPVAYMLHAGVPLLLDAGVCLPGLHPGDTRDMDQDGRPRRIALEAYPGLLARELIGRQSYKSDQRARQDLARMQARAHIVFALERGQTRLGLALSLAPGMRDTLVQDGGADCLDAVLCLVQAAWAWNCGWPRYGLPEGMDPLEGWIASAA